MEAAVRSSLMAGVALVGSSVIAVTPVAPPPPEIHVGSLDVRLAAAAAATAPPSLLNIPANLAIDLVNIPSNEIQALNMAASSLLFSGPWWVPSNTNLWGVDPGDPPHFMSVVDLLVPFPALSGLGLSELSQIGLGQQLWQLAAAELPVNQYCAIGCAPNVPTSPITGITGLDQLIWGAALLAGLWGFVPGASVRYPLFQNWFQVPLSQLMSGYTFGTNYPAQADPSGPAYPLYGLLGTTGPQNLMPWANTTFTLDLAPTFQNFFNSLMADPSTNPIQLPDLVQFGRTLQALAAGLVVAFDPITAGSGWCPFNCSWLPASLDYPALVADIGALWPGNTLIDQWLAAFQNGTANVPTPTQIQTILKISATPPWDFGNPNPPPAIGGSSLSALAPQFHAMWASLFSTLPPQLDPLLTFLGLNLPPLATPAPATTQPPAIAAAAQAPATTQPRAIAAAAQAPATDPAPSIAPREQKPVGAIAGGPVPEQSQPTPPQVGQGPNSASTIHKAPQSTTTSTNPVGEAPKSNVTDDGTKVEPRHVGGNDASGGGLAGAPNATRGQSGSSQPANHSAGSNGGSTSGKPGHSGSK